MSNPEDYSDFMGSKATGYCSGSVSFGYGVVGISKDGVSVSTPSVNTPSLGGVSFGYSASKNGGTLSGSIGNGIVNGSFSTTIGDDENDISMGVDFAGGAMGAYIECREGAKSNEKVAETQETTLTESEKIKAAEKTDNAGKMADEKANKRPTSSGDSDNGDPSPSKKREKTNQEQAEEAMGDPPASWPIVLDLDDDGEVELINQEGSTAFYDFDDDGYREQTGWASGEDGFLAIDLDGDGEIEGGMELAFALWGEKAITDYEAALEAAEESGDYTEVEDLIAKFDFNGDGVVDIVDFDNDGNGMISDLEGLRYFDSNKDGVIDENDEDWDKMKVWQDSDQDGETDEGELRSLEDEGIVEFELTSDEIEYDDQGNTVYGLGTYHTSDGGEHVLGDVSFSVSEIGFKENEDGSVSLNHDGDVEMRVFEDVIGDDGVIKGVEFDLSSTNPETIAAFGTSGDDVFTNSDKEYGVLIDGGAGDDRITGGAGNDFISGGAGADTLNGGAGHDVLFVDSEDTIDGGEGFDVVIATGSQGLNLKMGETNVEAVISGEGADVLDASGVDVSVYGGVTIDGGEGADTITGSSGDDILSGGGRDAVDVIDAGAGDDIIIADSQDKIDGGDGFDMVIFTDDADREINISDYNLEGIRGGDGDENIYTNTDQAVVLDGGKGDDKLRGSWGDDWLSGGEGSDILKGSYGDDTYYFSRGHGSDTIEDSYERTWHYHSKVGYVQQEDDGRWYDKNGDEIEDIKDKGSVGDADVMPIRWTFYSGKGWIGVNHLDEVFTKTGKEVNPDTFTLKSSGDGGPPIIVPQGNWGTEGYYIRQVKAGPGGYRLESKRYDMPQEIENKPMEPIEEVQNAGNDTLEFGGDIDPNDLIFYEFIRFEFTLLNFLP